jgi:hypothetical protein
MENKNNNSQSDTPSKQLTNGEKIQALNSLYEELDALKADATEKINLAKSHKEDEIEITRKDGKVQTLKESLIWDEVRILGEQTEGYELLKGKYPEAFESSEKVALKANEIDTFTIAQLGVHADRMTVRDILNLIVLFTAKEE